MHGMAERGAPDCLLVCCHWSLPSYSDLEGTLEQETVQPIDLLGTHQLPMLPSHIPIIPTTLLRSFLSPVSMSSVDLAVQSYHLAIVLIISAEARVIG